MSSVAALPADPFEIIPSHYVVLPNQGICVLTNYRTTELAGVMTDLAEFRNVKDLKSSIMKPSRRLQQVGVRLPMDAEGLTASLQKGFSNVKVDGGPWHHREEAYKNLQKTGMAEDLITLLNRVLSKHRAPKWKEGNVGFELPHSDKITVSYSERVIVTNAVKLLSEEIAHSTGMMEADARTIIYRAALVPGFAAKLKLSGEKGAPPHMDAEQFGEIFGFKPGEQSSGQPIKIDAIRPSTARMYQVADPIARQRTLGGNMGSGARKVLKFKNTGSAPRAGSGYNAYSVLTGTYLESYTKEEPLCPLKGVNRLLIKHAPRGLSEEQFNVIVPLALRDRASRVKIDDLVKDLGKTREEIIVIRDSAAKELRMLLDRLGYKVSKHPALEAYQETSRQTRANAAAKKAPEIAEGNREIFAREESKVGEKGTVRGLFLIAARVLEPQEFEILSQTILRKPKLRETMEAAATASGLSVAETILIYDSAGKKVAEAAPYDLTKPKSPKVGVPYEAKPVFERAVRAEKLPKMDRAIVLDYLSTVLDGDDVLLTIRVPKDMAKGTHGVKLNLDWKPVAGDSAPEIIDVSGIIKSKGNPHAAKGTAELAEPAIQPPPSTLDPS